MNRIYPKLDEDRGYEVLSDEERWERLRKTGTLPPKRQKLTQEEIDHRNKVDAFFAKLILGGFGILAFLYLLLVLTSPLRS